MKSARVDNSGRLNPARVATVLLEKRTGQGLAAVLGWNTMHRDPFAYEAGRHRLRDFTCSVPPRVGCYL